MRSADETRWKMTSGAGGYVVCTQNHVQWGTLLSSVLGMRCQESGGERLISPFLPHFVEHNNISVYNRR